jgi:hypothetical protein
MGRKFENKLEIIVRRRNITLHLAAALALKDDLGAFFAGVVTDRAQNPMAIAGSVAGVFIHMNRAEAMRAVIPRCFAQRLDFRTANGTSEPLVNHGKSTGFGDFIIIVHNFLVS